MAKLYDLQWNTVTTIAQTDYYDAPEIQHFNRVLTTQGKGALYALGAGVLMGWGVTAGAGLSVNIAAGAGIAFSSQYGPVHLRTAASIARNVPASSTINLFAAIDVSAGNDSRETATPAFPLASTATLNGAVLIATIATSDTAVTSIVLPNARDFDIQKKSALTAKGDLYAATANGDTTRLGVGANSQVLVADSTTSTGLKYSLVLTDMIATGQISKEQLDYAVASDISLNLAANVWTDFIGNQTFTIDRADSRQPYLSPFGSIGFYPTSGTGRVALRAVIDNTTNLFLSACPFNANPVNALSGCGTTPLDGLAAGSHTIKIQVMAEQAGTLNCRAASVPSLEFFRMRLVEGKR